MKYQAYSAITVVTGYRLQLLMTALGDCLKFYISTFFLLSFIKRAPFDTSACTLTWLSCINNIVLIYVNLIYLLCSIHEHRTSGKQPTPPLLQSI